jgi:hypothetical protein
MDVIELMAFAKSRLKSNDPAYKERVEATQALLRSLGVLPHKRISINGKLNTLFCGAIVSAYDNHTGIDIYTGRMGVIHLAGESTMLIRYLDACVKRGLLIAPEPYKIAKGKLRIGEMLMHYLELASMTVHVPLQRGLDKVLAA